MATTTNIFFYTICFIFCNSKSWSNAELFSAISHMEPLLETQKAVIGNLEAYLQKEYKRIGVLTKYLERFKKESATMNGPDYFANPINSFQLIKRLTIDLTHMENKIQAKSEYKRNTSLIYPDQGDLIGAAQGLSRLQDTYQLTLTSMANGFLKGVNGSVSSMSASDCFEIAVALYKSKEYMKGVFWSKEALNRYSSKEKEFYSFGKEDIVEQISFGYHLVHDYRNALEWLKRLLDMRPGDPRYNNHLRSIDYFEHMISQEELDEAQRKYGNMNAKADLVDVLSPYEKLKKMYDSTCRGEKVVPDKVIKTLKCRYLKESHPFLRLAPIKLEQLYIRPNIYLMHQILNDDDIKSIMKLAKPKLERVLTDDCVQGQALNRTSKIAWLRDAESEALTRATRRVFHFTRLSTRSSEPYEVANYGIGGHYAPHYDYCGLSGVTSGGATVFTKLGLSVNPIKGSALFWFSLHRSGEGDLATNHGSCPVLHGSKWVMNKYLNEAGQELIRPCNLRYQKEGYLKSPHPRHKSNL